MHTRVVLVLSTDPFAAALLGAASELASLVAVFPAADESPRAALRRARPALALIDCDHEEACADAVIGPALMMGARVALFAAGESHRVVESLAAVHDVVLLRLPADLDDLYALLRDFGSPVEA